MTIAEQHYYLKIKFVQTLSNMLIFNQWNDTILADAEAECGFTKGYCQIIFPEGLNEIVDFFEQWQDQKMLDLLSQHESPSKIRDKINLALNIRIKNCVPKSTHLRSSTYFSKPQNAIFSSKTAFRTCDLIWRYVGDKSIDYNYYTKRMLLLGVYISSIIYYTKDESINDVATDEYIYNSLSKIVNTSSKFKNILKSPNFANLPIIRLFS